MRTILFALVSLSIVASAKPVTGKAKTLPAASCPAADRLPFPLPSDELTDEWADTEWELWAVSAWEAYCTGREQSHVCRCARLNGGGAY